MQTYHMACTETGLKMCCRPQTLTLKPLLNKNRRRKKRAQLGRRHRISIPHVFIINRRSSADANWLYSPVTVESYSGIGENSQHQSDGRLLITVNAQQARLLDLVRWASTAATADIRFGLALVVAQNRVVIVDRVVITCGHISTKTRTTATRRFIKITSWIQWNTVAITITRRVMNLGARLWCNCISRGLMTNRTHANMAGCCERLLRDGSWHHHQIACAACAKWLQFDGLGGWWKKKKTLGTENRACVWDTTGFRFHFTIGV